MNKFPLNYIDKALANKITEARNWKKQAERLAKRDPAQVGNVRTAERTVEHYELSAEWRKACRASGVDPDDDAVFLAAEGKAWEAYNEKALAFSAKWSK